MTITDPGLYPNIPEKDYHADPVEAGSFSSTMAKYILKSPAHLRHYLDTPREEKPAFDFGKLVHAGVLGVGSEVEVLDVPDYRTKAARELRDAAYAAGKVPMKVDEYEEVQQVVDTVLGHPVAGQLFDPENGAPEVSMFAQHPSGVWLRGRADWINNSGIIVDLKSVQTADPNDFARTAWSFDYDLQTVMYEEIYRLSTGQPPRGFVHVLVDKNPPHLVTIVQLDQEFLDLGRSKMERAIARYKQAIETNEWPGYPNVVHSVSPQAWMSYAEDDQEEFEEKFNERNAVT